MTDYLLTLDLDKWNHKELSLEEFTILNIYNTNSHILISKLKDSNSLLQDKLKKLEKDGWLKIIESAVVLREKTLSMFSEQSNIDFDEFWNAFPKKTPNGRPLRASNKIISGLMTRDYRVCSKKYLSVVKDNKLHKEIVKIIQVKNRILPDDKKNFENNMETYINQRKWEQDVIYLNQGEDNDKFTERA